MNMTEAFADLEADKYTRLVKTLDRHIILGSLGWVPISPEYWSSLAEVSELSGIGSGVVMLAIETANGMVKAAEVSADLDTLLAASESRFCYSYQNAITDERREYLVNKNRLTGLAVKIMRRRAGL